MDKFVTRDISLDNKNSGITNGNFVERLFALQNEGIDVISDSEKGEVSIKQVNSDEIRTVSIKKQEDNLAEIMTITTTKIVNSDVEERKIISFYRENNYTQDETAFVTDKSQSYISVKENNR